MPKETKVLDIFINSPDVSEDLSEWIENWRTDVDELTKSFSQEKNATVISARVSDADVLESLIAVLEASYSKSADWEIDGVPQSKSQEGVQNHDADLQDEVKIFVNSFKSDPRNKIIVPWELLLKSAKYESQKMIEPKKLEKSIRNFLRGRMNAAEQELYDAAVAVCGELARACFAPDQEDCDYEISWIEDEKTFIAEVRAT